MTEITWPSPSRRSSCSPHQPCRAGAGWRGRAAAGTNSAGTAQSSGGVEPESGHDDSGMGLATARAFAEAGAAVVLADINQAALTSRHRELAAPGTRCSGCRATSPTRTRSPPSSPPPSTRSAGSTWRSTTPASSSRSATRPTSRPRRFDRVTAINLRGVWACMKHELAQMRTQGSGAIVNCSSLGGLVGNPGRAAYHASKHGVLGLTRSAALEYAPRGVRINAVCPGTIATPMVTDMLANGELDLPQAMANQPINRLGEPEEIAAAVLWLCSPGASFIIGVALPVDGGYTAR